MPRENKLNDAQYEARIQELIPVVSIFTRKEIVRLAQTKLGWDVSVRQIDNYIREAKKIIAEQYVEHRDKAAQNALNNLLSIMKKNFGIEHPSNQAVALNAMKEYNRIFGLVTDKVDHTSKGEQITGFTVELYDAKKEK